MLGFDNFRRERNANKISDQGEWLSRSLKNVVDLCLVLTIFGGKEMQIRYLIKENGYLDL